MFFRMGGASAQDRPCGKSLSSYCWPNFALTSTRSNIPLGCVKTISGSRNVGPTMIFNTISSTTADDIVVLAPPAAVLDLTIHLIPVLAKIVQAVKLLQPLEKLVRLRLATLLAVLRRRLLLKKVMEVIVRTKTNDRKIQHYSYRMK